MELNKELKRTPKEMLLVINRLRKLQGLNPVSGNVEGLINNAVQSAVFLSKILNPDILETGRTGVILTNNLLHEIAKDLSSI